MGCVDNVHERKRFKAQSRQQKSLTVSETTPMVPDVDCESPTLRLSSTSSADQSLVDSVYELPPCHQYSTTHKVQDLSNLAREADRYAIADRPVAALVTAALIDPCRI